MGALLALGAAAPELPLRDFLSDAVHTLADDRMEGRAAGSAGIELAAQYIEQELRKFGLRPGGDGGSYRQVFEIATGVELLEGNRLQIQRGQEQHSYQVSQDYLPLSPSDSGSVEGQLIFVGYGITAPEFQYDDYAGADVQDKVVLLLQGEPGQAEDKEFFSGGLVTFHGQVRAKLSAARAHGARAVLMVAGAIGDWAERDDFPELKGGAAGGDAGLCAVQIKRSAAQQILAADGRDLKTLQEEIELKKAGRNFPIGSAADLEVRLKKLHQKTANLVGWVEGTDPKLRERTIVVGAHYDHLGYGGEHSLAPEQHQIHNGADDNASGVAGMLALARAFAAAPPRHTMLFIAFSAEEVGLLGSAYQVEHPEVALGQTVAMLNLDMIGRPSRDTLQVIGVSSAAEFPDLVRGLGRESEGLKIAAEGLTKSGEGSDPSQPAASALIGGSDQLSYLQKDVPALFLFAGQHEDYHRPTDDADKINYDGMTRVVRYAQDLLGALDRYERPLTFQKLPEAPNLGPGHRAWLGTVPDYGEMEAPGVKLSGVRAGSPAELAGVRGGDILVRLDEVEIRNLYDFQYALNGRRPGDTVTVVVMRDGERLELKATLGTRP